MMALGNHDAWSGRKEEEERWPESWSEKRLLEVCDYWVMGFTVPFE